MKIDYQSRKLIARFCESGRSYGVKGLRATNSTEAKQVMLEAFAREGPVVVDFCVEEGENVFPMVPPNKGITK